MLGAFLLTCSVALLYPPARSADERAASASAAHLGTSRMLSAVSPISPDGNKASDPEIEDLPPLQVGHKPADVEPIVRAPRTETLRMLVTAYCPCPKCCGRYSDGVTASGKSVYTNGSLFVAADTRLLPFGSKVSVPGYYGGAPVPVLDRGRRIKGYRLDVFFLSHSQAKRWGKRWLDVTVYLD